jgi:hypothetical protein
VEIVRKGALIFVTIFLEGTGYIFGGISFFAILFNYDSESEDVNNLLLFFIPLSIFLDVVTGLPLGSYAIALFTLNICYSLVSMMLPESEMLISGIGYVLSFAAFRITIQMARAYSLGEGLFSIYSWNLIWQSLLVGVISWLFLLLLKSLSSFLRGRRDTTMLKL